MLKCVPSRRASRRQPKDQPDLFLRDLRRLRSRRKLSLDQLAERAGCTAEQLAGVEEDPGLPSLPALEAYLRGCGEPLAEWEDRWRRLTQAPDAAGSLPKREPGTTPLAAAGAAQFPRAQRARRNKVPYIA